MEVSSRSHSVARSALLAWRLVAGGQFRPFMPPLRFLVYGRVGNTTQRPDHAAIAANDRGGEHTARRLIHKRHELVGEARHGATDADAANVRAAADAAHPSALGHIAIHHRTPAAQ